MSSSIPSQSLQILDVFIHLMHDANLSRYFSAAGLVVLLYDHLLTLGDEIMLIWRAPASWAKYLFLLNRYLVPAMLLVIATEMCGFSPFTFNRTSCQTLVILSSLIGIVSLGIANILILRRVTLLWENNATAKTLLTTGFLISFCTTFALMLITMIRLRPGFVWNDLAGMCITEQMSPLLIGVWVSPMVFEVIVLVATCWNALARPMDESIAMTKALQRDGIVFFCALTILRAINLSLAITMKPELSIMLVFFVWSMTTLVLNRSLLESQKVEVKDQLRLIISKLPRNASPFGLDPSQLDHYDANGDMSYEMDQPDARSSGWTRSFAPELYDIPFVYDGSKRSIHLVNHLKDPLSLDLGPSFSSLVAKPLRSLRKSRSASSLGRFFHTPTSPIPPLPSHGFNKRNPRYDELPSDWSHLVASVEIIRH